MISMNFFVSSRRRHTSCALVTGVQTCALPIWFRSALQYERITPFVCFGWGVDFAPGSSILERVITMNEFYPLNRIFVFKREDYAPVSMCFRSNEWDTAELYATMLEIAETRDRKSVV